MKPRRGDWWHDDPLDWHWMIPVAIAIIVLVATAVTVILRGL